MMVLLALILLHAEGVEPQDSEDPFTRTNIRDAGFIKKKLEAGLSPEAKNDTRFNHDTLLVFAVRHEAPDTVEVLLKAGAKVDRRTPGFSKTALFQAAYGGNVEVARMLVKHEADVNAVDDPGNNALREAILAKKPRMVEYLLEAGCEPGRSNKQGETMIEIAEKHGTPEIKRLMKEKRRDDKQERRATRPARRSDTVVTRARSARSNRGGSDERELYGRHPARRRMVDRLG